MFRRVIDFFFTGRTRHVGAVRGDVRGSDDQCAFIQALLQGARYGEARIAAMECLARTPDDVNLLEQLAGVFCRSGISTGLPDAFEVAITLLNACLSKRLSGPPEPREALTLLWTALMAVRRYDEAVDVLRKVTRRAPMDSRAVAALANCHNILGDMPEAWAQYCRLLEMAPIRWPILSARIAALDYMDDVSPQENFRQRMESMAKVAGAGVIPVRYENDPDMERTLRIGFVSPDMRQHVVATALFEGVLRAHAARDSEEWTIYDATPGRDTKNAELRTLAPRWREIDKLDPDQAAALIQSDRIDILVDLAGHSSHNSLAVFARKPTPIQASWLGYPGSTGLPQIDWLISDIYSSPAEQESYVSERIWRLPATRLCYTAPVACPAPRLPATMGPVSFGCFNNFGKLNPTVFSVWRRILDGVPGSRLLLKAGALDHQSACARLEVMLDQAGIERRRVDFWGWSDVLDTLDQYGDIHIALDPFPFCGGLTSLDALWMGVPVVTLDQPLLAGRQTLAMLHNIDASELIARDHDDYVRIGIALAKDANRLASYRATLRRKMKSSALTDQAALARNLDIALRGMWQEWCTAQKAF